jgi:hypothetical protein
MAKTGRKLACPLVGKGLILTLSGDFGRQSFKNSRGAVDWRSVGRMKLNSYDLGDDIELANAEIDGLIARSLFQKA